MQKTDFLEHPWPAKRRCSIVPIFLPFLGCPAHCVFCAQDKQTGISQSLGMRNVEMILKQAEISLVALRQGAHARPQAAFYGGTFTAVPDPVWNLCLNYIRKWNDMDLIKSFRCSTRPDSLAAGRLCELAQNGCAMVELGVQSFNGRALEQSGRNYSSAVCIEACDKIVDAGFELGIQLMPGMPGVDEAIFLEDVIMALDRKAAALRYYPCLVIAGTGLATLWEKGAFTPWPVDRTIHILAQAWNMATEKGVDVIRMGVAPETGFNDSILAGPVHAALGNRVIGTALFYLARKMRAGLGHKHEKIILYVPESTQGLIWGWRGELKEKWKELGLSRDDIFYWHKNQIRMEAC